MIEKFLFIPSFIIALFGLILASIEDIKYKEVSNLHYKIFLSLGILLLGIYYYFFNIPIYSLGIHIGLIFIVFLIFTYLGHLLPIKDGDKKIIFGIVPLIPLNVFSIFLILLIPISIGYIIYARTKNKQKLPFVPAILLSYIISIISYFFIQNF